MINFIAGFIIGAGLILILAYRAKIKKDKRRRRLYQLRRERWGKSRFDSPAYHNWRNEVEEDRKRPKLMEVK